MTDEQKTTNPRKRRTAEELRAYHEAELKRIAEREKAELLKLLAGVHDDLQAASTHPQGKPHAPAITTALSQIRLVLAALEKK